MRLSIDTHIVSALMPDLIGHDRSPAAFIVYLYLFSRAPGRARRVSASLQTIADDTGLSKSAVQLAIRRLTRRRLLRVQRAAPTAIPAYEVLRPWVRARAA